MDELPLAGSGLPQLADPVQLHAEPAGDLRPGRDLVLYAPASLGLELPWGVLLDDWLDQDRRAAIDADALARQERWLAHARAGLTVRGVPVADVWWNELLPEVFLPLARVLGGLRALGASRLRCHGLPQSLVEVLRAELEAEVEVATAAADGHRASTRSVVPRRAWAQKLFDTARRTGVPGLPRGEVLLLPYWHIVPLAEALARGDGPRLMLLADRPAPVSREALARTLRRSGWVGVAGGARRARSRRQTLRAIERLPAPEAAADRLAHEHACALIRARGAETVAEVEAARRGLRRAKLVVLPNDAMPDARTLVEAARGAGAQTMVVQHGFYGEPNEPDKALADHVAVWSEEDLEINADRVRGTMTLTGNPGTVEQARRPFRRAPATGVTLVLVEAPSRGSARNDERVSMRHAHAALAALAQARPGTTAVLRPHPGDPYKPSYLALRERFGQLTVELDTTSPIDELIARADLCVGAVSTASLQAGVAGVPTVVLNADRIPRMWPFDGSGGFPIAYGIAELARVIPELLEGDDVPGVEAMRAALGLRPDALERLLALVDQVANSRASSP